MAVESIPYNMHVRTLPMGQLHRPARAPFSTQRPRLARLSIRAAVKVGEKAPDFTLRDEVRACLLAIAACGSQLVQSALHSRATNEGKGYAAVTQVVTRVRFKV